MNQLITFDITDVNSGDLIYAKTALSMDHVFTELRTNYQIPNGNFAKYAPFIISCKKTLDGINFAGGNFSNVKFEGVSFKNIDFSKTNLSNVGFYDCKFYNSNFKYSNMFGTIFDNCSINCCDFVGANIHNATFIGEIPEQCIPTIKNSIFAFLTNFPNVSGTLSNKLMSDGLSVDFICQTVDYTYINNPAKCELLASFNNSIFFNIVSGFKHRQNIFNNKNAKIIFDSINDWVSNNYNHIFHESSLYKNTIPQKEFVEGVVYEIAYDFFEYSDIKKEKAKFIKRGNDEFTSGWLGGWDHMLDLTIKIENYLFEIGADNAYMLCYLYANGVINIKNTDEITFYINCSAAFQNDEIYNEFFEIKEIIEIFNIYEEYNIHGVYAWVNAKHNGKLKRSVFNNSTKYTDALNMLGFGNGKN